MRAIVSEKGQVTIPKPLREQLGIRAGETLELDEEEGRLVAWKASERDPVDELYGILDLDGDTDTFVAEARGDRAA